MTDPQRAGEYVVRLDRGHERLAAEAWRQYEVDQMSPYFVLHLPAQLAECRRGRELSDLLLDFQWIQNKLECSRDIPALLADYGYHAGGEAHRLLKEAIALSADVVSAFPQELASQLLGRLLAHRQVGRIGGFSPPFRRKLRDPRCGLCTRRCAR